MTGKKKETLRSDTTLAPIEEPEAEVYVRAMPVCCLAAFKKAVVRSSGEHRQSELRCRCGRGWRVTSSLDQRVLEHFETQRNSHLTGGSYPAA